MIYYKNPQVQTQEHLEELFDGMDNFVSGGTGKPQPRLDVNALKIWNDGKRLSYEWSDKTKDEIEEEIEQAEREEQKAQAEQEKIDAYKADLELFKDEKIRPWRDWAMVSWFDSIRSKPELWEEQTDEVKTEALALRGTLKTWPDTFTKYVTDQTIDNKKPTKPSYITV